MVVNEDKVKEIVSETFKISRADILMDMTPDDIELWDSLGQLMLINNLEKEFNVIFELDEIFEIISIADVLTILKRKEIV